MLSLCCTVSVSPCLCVSLFLCLPVCVYSISVSVSPCLCVSLFLCLPACVYLCFCVSVSCLPGCPLACVFCPTVSAISFFLGVSLSLLSYDVDVYDMFLNLMPCLFVCVYLCFCVSLSPCRVFLDSPWLVSFVPLSLPSHSFYVFLCPCCLMMFMFMISS